jgi:phosphoglycolate phosphatase-like HAD superfamily hydrolase
MREPLIALFDVDQTLIRSGGAGVKAVREAFREIWGIDDATVGMDYAGRSDFAILRDLFAKHGLDIADPALLDRYLSTYLAHLARLLEVTGGEVLPGVREILDVFRERPGHETGLVTGNLRTGAELKLRRFGIWDYFAEGGFAEDGERREEIVAAATRRFAARAGRPLEARHFAVFGDTPHDVAAARAHGIRVVAVATGYFDAEALRAAGAEFVVPDLSDTAGILTYLNGQAP